MRVGRGEFTLDNEVIRIYVDQLSVSGERFVENLFLPVEKFDEFKDRMVTEIPILDWRGDNVEEYVDVVVEYTTLNELRDISFEEDTINDLGHFMIDHYLGSSYISELMNFNEIVFDLIEQEEVYEVTIERSKVDQLMKLANEIGFDVEFKK